MVSNRQESDCPRVTCKWWLPHSKVTCLLCTEMLIVALHWAVACRTQESLIQKLCGQRGGHRQPHVARNQRRWGPGSVFPAQEQHGKDRWAWVMELWTEVCGPKGQGAKSDRGISREWSTAPWVPEGRTSLRAGDRDEGYQGSPATTEEHRAVSEAKGTPGSFEQRLTRARKKGMQDPGPTPAQLLYSV